MDILSTDEIKTRVTGLNEPPVGVSSGQACLVVIHASLPSELGRRFVLDKPVLNIGRGRNNDIVMSSDAVSRWHSKLEQRGTQVFACDLGSTNGTFVNDEARLSAERRLNGGDLIKVGDTIFKYLSGDDVEAQYHEVVFRMAVTDGLTNLSNRQQLDTLLGEEITRVQRQGRKLSILMVDIDHFKSVNDKYGHLAGDSVLRGVAAIMQKRLRPTDRLGRYGGEEFCAILVDTGLNDAATVAEELRDSVEMRVFAADDKQVNVTISIGVADWRAGMVRDDLYHAADMMLYSAKHSGRNRVRY